jgi:hypothetical protein
MIADTIIIAPSPNQSDILSATGTQPPPAIASRSATLQTMAVADDYFREVKRRKANVVPSASTEDVCSAEVNRTYMFTVAVLDS